MIDFIFLSKSNKNSELQSRLPPGPNPVRKFKSNNSEMNIYGGKERETQTDRKRGWGDFNNIGHIKKKDLKHHDPN